MYKNKVLRCLIQTLALENSVNNSVILEITIIL